MDKKLSISFILPGAGRAGGVRVPVIQSNMLLKRGHNVKICCYRNFYNIKDLLRFIKSIVLYYNSSDWLKIFEGETKWFKNITECDFKNNDIIIGVGMWASQQIDKLKYLKNHKVQYIHGWTPWDMNLMKETLELPYPKIIIANYLNDIVSKYGNANVLALIYNGIDKSEYYCYKDQRKREGFGFVYQNHFSKDPKTMDKIIEKFNKDGSNTIIRGFGFGKRPGGIKKENYFRYPTIDVTRQIYNDSAVWIVPSRSEGFSLVILEAMACGCAVIATDCGAASEVIEDGESGFIAKVGDWKGITEMVSMLLNDVNLRCKISNNALKVSEKFTWEKNVNELEQTLYRL